MSESVTRVSCISPARVKECLDAGEAIFILDVRPRRNDQEIPASFWFDPMDLLQADRIVLSARNDQLIVVYDDSPDEEVSRQVAAKLVAHDYWNAHPLEGGLKAWRAAGFPTVPRPVETLIGTE